MRGKGKQVKVRTNGKVGAETYPASNCLADEKKDWNQRKAQQPPSDKSQREESTKDWDFEREQVESECGGTMRDVVGLGCAQKL